MEKLVSHVSRRDFMIGSAALAAAGVGLPMQSKADSSGIGDEFSIYQQRRRWELWNLLGDLPWDHRPAPPRVMRTEKHDGYTLERLVLDLNGLNQFRRCCSFPIGVRSEHPACSSFTGTPASTIWAKNNCCAAQVCNRLTRQSVRKKGSDASHRQLVFR